MNELLIGLFPDGFSSSIMPVILFIKYLLKLFASVFISIPSVVGSGNGSF